MDLGLKISKSQKFEKYRQMDLGFQPTPSLFSEGLTAKALDTALQLTKGLGFTKHAGKRRVIEVTVALM